MSRVLVIGGGASGIIAAIAAAYNGNEVTLVEKNEKLGKKLYITGKGRCNVTNASSIENHFANIVRNSKFLYSAYNNFSYEDIYNMIENTGVKLKIERGDRVFPESDKSSDIIWALSKMLKDIGVKIIYGTNIISINSENEIVAIDSLNNKFVADYCIVATGGVSYPVTGSTGDGYEFAKKFGHKIEKTYPSLVPFNTKEEYCKDMQGLSLKNVELAIKSQDGKIHYKDQGEMMFTHFGITGPLVLSASAYIVDKMKDNKFTGYIDLKPALDFDTLDKRVLKDFSENVNKNFNNSLDKLLPKKMIPVIISLSGIDQYKKVHEITKEERHKLIKLLKEFPVTIVGTRNYNEAIITKGGISTKEINPRTMESKLIPNVFFVGEVLDVDALTGGYNLQIAWSTGYLAGSSIY